MTRRHLALAGLAALLALPAAAQQAAPAPGAATRITVTDAWARAPAGAGRTGAAYLSLSAEGAPDQLVGASTPAAERAELHESSMSDGVMRMRPVAAMPVAPGRPVTMAPGGLHIMLFGMRPDIKPGGSFPLTLRFARAGEVTAEVRVRATGAAGAHEMNGMHDMAH